MARKNPPGTPHIRKQYACLACAKQYPSAEEARECGCRIASEEAAAELERKVLSGEITEGEGVTE